MNRRKVQRLTRRQKKKRGLSPGTPVHVGDVKMENQQISLMDFGPDHLTEKRCEKASDTFGFRDTPSVSWINLAGLHDLAPIEGIGRHFDIHPLTIEDVVNTTHRPKAEFFETYLFMTLKTFTCTAEGHLEETEQVSLILGQHFLVTFQERAGGAFDYLRERIRNGRGRVRKSCCDYLAYALVDAVVDGYFQILERLDERVEHLDQQLIEDPGPETLHRIHHLKRELLLLRKQVRPLLEVLSVLMREESPLIREETLPFLRDLRDHTVQVLDTIESLRDVLSGMQDLYLSTASHRMNEVMKVLTIIATTFIPMTFLTGVYGMNFKYMPELEWRWAYPSLWVLLLVVFFLMLRWFRGRGWL